jgi:hypothetical protein
VHSAILRKRILGILLVVLTALMFTAYVYYRSTFSRRYGDWRWFWVGEAMAGAWLVVGITLILTQAPKS